MTAAAAPVSTLPVTAARRVPQGGFSGTLLRLEIRRLLRNRRTLILGVLMPAVFFFLFGGQAYTDESAGRGNVSAYVMISLMVYGAMLSTTSGGASVAIERAQGWSRQLRLTPLNPLAYIATKAISAMVLGGLSILVAMAAGAVGGARMTAWVWVAAALIAWVGSLVFSAFGLFVGYLLPSENVMQLLGPALALLAFLGGLFVPLGQLGGTFQTVAEFTPAYGVGALARLPLTGDALTVAPVANVVIWTALFALGAAWRFRRDTARV